MAWNKVIPNTFNPFLQESKIFIRENKNIPKDIWKSYCLCLVLSGAGEINILNCGWYAAGIGWII